MPEEQWTHLLGKQFLSTAVAHTQVPTGIRVFWPFCTRKVAEENYPASTMNKQTFGKETTRSSQVNID